MTTVARRPEVLEPPEAAVLPAAPEAAIAAPELTPPAAVGPNRLAVVCSLACLAAAFLVARLFLDAVAAFAVAGLGVALGLGLSRLSCSMSRPALLQYAIAPVALLAGVALVAPSVRDGGASIWGLVSEALQAGGLSQAPVSFDPGWRLLVVVLLTGLAAVTFLAASATSRARLGVVLPLPVVVGAALLQPKGSEAVLAIPLGLLLAALAIAAGGDLHRHEGGRSFEIRRLGRGAGLLLLLMVGVAGLAQIGFLFPDTTTAQTIPPQRPPTPPPLPDRPLFTATATIPGPWRVGVLDSQDKDGYFLLPPVDPATMSTLGADGSIPQSIAGPTQRVTFTIAGLPGHELPLPSSALRISGPGGKLQWDPRAGSLRLDRLVQAGDIYTVTMAVPPDARQMSAAPAPEPSVASLYEAIAPPPAAVTSLLAKAPASGFDRLQFVRQALYGKVIAAGTGQPVPVTPDRVAQMLAGGDASPYEITAAEVMLARWAGFPARLGFGFYAGTILHADSGTNGSPLTTYQVRPSNGAAWLEVYFRGYGWVPIVGTPPRAAASLDNNQKNQAPTTQADVLDLQVYVPIRIDNLLPLYEITRYWVLVMLPVVAGVLAVLVFYPAALKAARRWRRRRWARHHGSLAALVVAYAEFRDRCHDLNVGRPHWTPLEFLRALDVDDEHLELASLYTRGVWGDIARDLRDDDVSAADAMSASLRRRVTRAQPALNRMVAAASRASLRQPYCDEVPNLWPRRRAWRRPGFRWARRRRLLLSPATIVAVLLATSAVSSCGSGNPASPARQDYPARIVPAQVMEYTVTPQPTLQALFARPGGKAAVSGGRVFTFRDSLTVEGSLQVSAFAADIDSQDPAEQAQIEQQIGTGAFRTVLFGTVRLREGFTSDLHFYLWFPPEHSVMELFVFRTQAVDVESVVRHVIAYQRGLTLPDRDLIGSGSLAPPGTTLPAPTPPASPPATPGGST